MRKLFIFFTAWLAIFSNAYSQRTGSLGGTQLVPEGDITALDKTIKDFSQYSFNSFLNGSVMKSFNSKENTKGKRYFFDDWVKGSVIDNKGKVIDNEKFSFNVDKVSNDLLVTEDKGQIIEVDKSYIRYVSLKKGNETTNFERVDIIDPKVYLRVVTKKEGSPGYTLYKSISTTFVKANYYTDGLMESGNPYDEYVDADQFYLLFPDSKEFKPVTLKPKSIRTALKSQSKKVNDYFYEHAGENVDDSFLKGLVDYINQ